MPAMRFALVATRENATNRLIAEAGGADWACLTPGEAVERLRAGDVAVGRMDVLPGLDGVDGGLRSLGELEAAGARVLNPASALIAAHDKLVTARLLQGAGLPHPRTWCVTNPARRPSLVGPSVVKPRFGSWGRAVVRCADDDALGLALEQASESGWFTAHGALVQELVPPCGFDLRILVAGLRVVGAIRRVAAPGEWRTNIALGGHRERVEPPADACELALACAAVAGTDLVGVDLIPVGRRGWAVIELNGAVDFTEEYSRAGDVFVAVARELERVSTAQTHSSGGEPALSPS
jgi:RimK family alpha-L-glutamate ligase